MSDILFRCQIRSAKAPDDDILDLFIARFACAVENTADLEPGDSLWPFIQPWRWEALTWHMALADTTFAINPTVSAHPREMLAGPSAEAAEKSLGYPPVKRLGLPGEATAVELLRSAHASDPDEIEIRPLSSHGARTWLTALEGIGTGPGALARRMSLASLLRPEKTAIVECLPGRVAFVPAFRLDGEDYLPEKWELVRFPEATGLDPTNREALLVTYASPADRPVIKALILPSLRHTTSAVSYINAGTLEVALTGTSGQTARFDRDWPASFTRRVSEAFDLPSRLTDPHVLAAVYRPNPANPSPADQRDWEDFLNRVLTACARDASGTGTLVTAGRVVPAARLLTSMMTADGTGQPTLSVEARDAILTALAAYEQRFNVTQWETLFKAFLEAERMAAQPSAAQLAARGALLCREDVTAAFLLQQWKDALAGPAGTGYALQPGNVLRIAQAIATTGSTLEWVTLIPPFAGGATTAPQPFYLNLLVTPSAQALGELLVLTLAANPAGPAVGQQLELVLSMTDAGAQWSLNGVQFGGLIVPDATGAVRINGVIEITDTHAPLKLTLNGGKPDLAALGSATPMLEVAARQALTVRFGPDGLADLLGRKAAITAAGREPFFTSPFAERLSKIDPQGWLILGPPTLSGKLASGAAVSSDPTQSLRKRMLVAVTDAFKAYLDARMDQARCWPLLPFPASPGDDNRTSHLKTILIDRFNKTYGDETARESTSIVPLDSDEAVDLPLPDAHPIIVPYDLGDAIPLNDLIGETTGVAVLVEADGKAFATDQADEDKFAGTFTLNAARLEYAGGDVDQELCIGSRPSVPDGADIRSFSFNARPLVAPLGSEIDQLEQLDEHLYRIMPFSSTSADQDWGRRVPQMRFGWKYRFRSFLVSQGGALPPDLWEKGDPAMLRRPAVGETNGFGEAFSYLCRTPVSAPRWVKSPVGRRPESSLPLAAELPDLPPPVDVPEAGIATYYVSDQDGSGLLPFSTTSPLEIKLYGLRIADDGEAIVSLRRGRLGAADDYINIRLRPSPNADLGTDDGDFLVLLPKDQRDTYGDADSSEWHVRLLVKLTQATAVLTADLMMEADAARRLPSLEPDLLHALEPIGNTAAITTAIDAIDVYIAVTAEKGSIRVVPPRVWAGPYRQICPETAGQQPEIIALDSRSGEVSVDIRPPAATFSTWVRHLLSDKPLFDESLNKRIDVAFKASQQERTGGKSAALDHPRVVSLFVELVPLFPRARTSGALHEIRLPVFTEENPANDQKTGVMLQIGHAKGTAFDLQTPAVDIQINGKNVAISIASGHVAEVRVYAAIDARDFEGPKARFAASIGRGRRRKDAFVLSVPLRLRVEASANAALVDTIIPPSDWRSRLTGRAGDTFSDWGHLIVDGTGKLQRVEARPTLAPPENRTVARILRLFASVTVFDQKWSWRGRTGTTAPQPEDDSTLESFGNWATRLFYGRSDKDAEFGEPIPLIPQRIRRPDRLDKEPIMPLTERDLDYHGLPVLWRFSAEFHGRYPNEVAFDRHTLTGSSSDNEAKRQGRWAHLIAKGALAGEGTGPGQPPEQRRPAFEIWLPLAEQLREASAAAPVLLMFSEPWYSRGNFGDRLQIASILARHPYPGEFHDGQGPSWKASELNALFGDDATFTTAKQYPKFWQSWGPDPILTGTASSFHAVTLAVSGPLGWTQSEGAHSDFRRTSFLLEPTANETTDELLALRPMFQLAHRRILDPDLVDLPAELLQGVALWLSAVPGGTQNAPRRCLQWSFYPPVERPSMPFAGQLVGFQGVRIDWRPPILKEGAPVFMRLEDATPSGTTPRRLVFELLKTGDMVQLRTAMSEPLLDQNPSGWRINHLPPIALIAQPDGELEIQLDVSPTAPAQNLETNAAPDTYDVVISARSSRASLWEGGILARFKAPDGNGNLRFDLPGSTDELASGAHIRPFTASPFAASFWTQFFSDSSRFRCQAIGSTSTSFCKIEAMSVKVFSGGAGFTAVVGANQLAVRIWPLVPDKAGNEKSDPCHRLVAVVTKWIADAEGRRSEMPIFASPVRSTAETGSYFGFPSNSWPTSGRVRILTVFATKEAPEFGPETEPSPENRFAVMQEILRAKNAAPGRVDADIVPFDLDTEDAEMAEATMMVVGVSKPLEF